MGIILSHDPKTYRAVNFATCTDDNGISWGSYCLMILLKHTGQSTSQLAPMITESHGSRFSHGIPNILQQQLGRWLVMTEFHDGGRFSRDSPETYRVHSQ
jgi:hypothetical protein